MLSLGDLVMPLSLSVKVNTKLVFSLTPGLLLRDNMLHVSLVTCVTRLYLCVQTHPSGWQK